MTSTLAGIRCRRRVVSCLLLPLYLPACSSWRVGTPTPAQFVENERPASVRVTRTDGSMLDLGSPVVRGDSLVGTSGLGLARVDMPRTVSLPLSDVRSVAVRRFSVGRTLLLVGVGIAVLVVAACAESSSSTNNFAGPC